MRSAPVTASFTPPPISGAAPDGAMQELLAMGAHTCYLHATLGAALSPQFD